MQTYSSHLPQSVPTQGSPEADAPLLLCCPEAFDDTDLGDLLTRDDRVMEQVTTDTAHARLKGLPGIRLLLLHEDPARFVARKLAEGVAPSEAARLWLEAIQPVLTLLRQNRQRVVLMRIAMIRAYPEVFATKLRFSDATARALAGHATPGIAPLPGMIAEHVRMQSPEIRRLAAELEASLLDLSNGAPNGTVESDTAYQAFMAMQQDISGLRAEVDGLNLHATQLETQLQDKLEAQQAEILDLEAQIDDLKTLNEGHQRSFDGERNMLMQMMQQVQKDLETRYAELRDTMARLHEEKQKTLELRVHGDALMTEKNRVTEKLAYVEALIQGIMQSRSYRIMAPLRKLRAAMIRRR